MPTSASIAAPRLPLEGIRVLALEQLQSMPVATQLLARFGAEVIKVEPIGRGDLGRGSLPAAVDPDGRRVGATFLRSNAGKRSICIDASTSWGRQLVLDLAKKVDVFAENSKPGSMDRLGLGYDAVADVNPACVYVSVSGFGHAVPTRYQSWLALAPVVEAMSGMYELKRRGDGPPLVAPLGAVADVGAGLYAAIGALVALRHRDQTGEGQHVDVAMYDAVVAMTDIVANLWSMGASHLDAAPSIMEGFRAGDGWFVLHVLREAQFAALCGAIGRPDLADDPRFADRRGWVTHLDDVLRPAIEGWAGDRTRLEVCDALSAAGIPAGPCTTPDEVAHEDHLRRRRMLLDLERVGTAAEPVLVSGNPAKLSAVPDDPSRVVPWLGEHTDAILAEELDLNPREIKTLRDAKVVA
jgi:crotonobetainyl-CoA:carnitine CoA-transferase CaiB-like acyl-CoA transferase